jgi:hypothetical protein
VAPTRGDLIRVPALLRGQRLDKAGRFELGQLDPAALHPKRRPGEKRLAAEQVNMMTSDGLT